MPKDLEYKKEYCISRYGFLTWIFSFFESKVQLRIHSQKMYLGMHQNIVHISTNPINLKISIYHFVPKLQVFNNN